MRTDGPRIRSDEDMQKLAPPQCGVCGTDVEAFYWAYDVLECQIRCVARCHGETEEGLITDEALEDRAFIGFGTAFAQKALPP